MASKSSSATMDLGLVLLPHLLLLLIMMMAGFGSSDLAQDRAECQDKLVGLAPCLTYVSGDAKAPTLDCCTSVKDVVDKSKKCLCILIKDRNDPNLGLKINATLAVKLPSTCHVPLNISACVDLLHLAPNSPEAKDFEDLAKLAGNSSTPAVSNASNVTGGSASSTNERSGGGWDKRWLMAKFACWISPILFVTHMIFFI